jgi:transcriptional regulator with XRE-family HTH domain
MTAVPKQLPSGLRSARINAGLTLEDLALLSGVHPSSLSKAERGLRHLSPESRLRVVKALRLDYETARGIAELGGTR